MTRRRVPACPAALALAAPVLAALGLLSGCFGGPSRDSATLFPSDSLSVRIEAGVPVDTLRLRWAAGRPEGVSLPVATSLAWAPGGGLVVAETQRGSLHFWSEDGAYAGVAALPEAGAPRYPYLVGTAGDALVVHSRGLDRLEVLRAAPGGTATLVRQIALPEGAQGAALLGAGAGARLGGDAPALVVVGPEGAVRARHPIDAPAWRVNGFVRAWGDSLVGLSGYRPVVDLLPPGRPDGHPADTLALAGFVSPQLRRSAQFVRGDAKEPPLLTSSAAPLGDRLFVLNLRLDHTRIDVYGRDGRLERVLVSPRPWQISERYAVDVAARARPGGGAEFAVLTQRQPGLLQRTGFELLVYRWDGP
ncbi:MAG: hypothetical protein ACK41D_02770 [Rubricoccaceae bacterium]